MDELGIIKAPAWQGGDAEKGAEGSRFGWGGPVLRAKDILVKEATDNARNTCGYTVASAELR